MAAMRSQKNPVKRLNHHITKRDVQTAIAGILSIHCLRPLFTLPLAAANDRMVSLEPLMENWFQ